MRDPNHVNDRGVRRRVRLRVTTARGASLTINVSGGGFCTGVLRVLPVGARVEGVILLDGIEAPFAGRVVWAAPGNPRMNVMGRMGVCFERIAPEFALLLSGTEPEPAGAQR